MDMKDFKFDLQRFDSAFSGGSGTAENPYQIATAADLQQLANDIDMSSVDDFTAIGHYSDKKFKGTFEGDNHTISNLTIKSSSDNFQGLFGYVDGTVQNVTVKAAKVTGKFNVGAVVGYNSGNSKISDCYYYNTTTPTNGGTQAYKLTLPEGVTLAEGSAGFYYDGAVYAASGATVTLTSKDALTVDSTKLTAGENNTYTYTMTAADATVTAGDFLDSLTKDTTDTSGNTYLITTADELQALASYVNGGNDCSGITFKLANDIDLKNVENFTRIGWYDADNEKDYYFSGTFDGDGCSLGTQRHDCHLQERLNERGLSTFRQSN